MKKFIVANSIDEQEIVYTPAALLDVLSQIDELSEYSLGLTEGIDGTIQLQVGDSYYSLELREADSVDVKLDEVDFEKVEEINESAYDSIIDVETNEPIEGGLIKEALKTLLIGGAVRLGKKYLQS